MSQESAPPSVVAFRWVAALLVVGAAGSLIAISTDPLWPQVVASLAAVVVAALAWFAPTRQGPLRAAAVVALLPVLWQAWALWQARWAVSFWLALTVVALLVVLLLTFGGALRRVPALVLTSIASVVLLTVGLWFGGGVIARATAEISQVASTAPPLVEGREGPGAYAYGWGNSNTRPVDTAYGRVWLEGENGSRLVASDGTGDPLWSYQLRPYEVADLLTSSSGEVVMVQLRLPRDVAVSTDLAAPVTRVWLDAGTGAVLDSIRWRGPDLPDDGGEVAATEATGTDWVIYEPISGGLVTYQDVLVGRLRIDTRVSVGLAFHPGEPQQVAWVRETPDRCAEHVLWSRDLGDWTLAADARTVAVARACVAEPQADGTPQVSVSVHGVDAATGLDVWEIEGPAAMSLERWSAGSPNTDERILTDAVGSMPSGQNVVEGVQVTHGESPTDPVMLGFFWGGGSDQPEVTVDLATGE